MRPRITQKYFWKTSVNVCLLELANLNKKQTQLAPDPDFQMHTQSIGSRGCFNLTRVLGLVLDDVCGLLFVYRFVVFLFCQFLTFRDGFIQLFKKISNSSHFLRDRSAWSRQVIFPDVDQQKYCLRRYQDFYKKLFFQQKDSEIEKIMNSQNHINVPLYCCRLIAPKEPKTMEKNKKYM